MSLPQIEGGSRLRGEMPGAVALWEHVTVKKKSRCRRICQYEGGLSGIAVGGEVAVAPEVGKVVAVRMAAADRPIVAIAPEIAAVAFAVVHVGHAIDYVWIVVSLVLRRQVGSCIR